MSDISANLSLPYLQPSQAQKHVTHNEALLRLDALVQLGVLSATVTTPPPSPEDGDRYVVPAGGSGDWSGQDDAIAMWTGEAWVFLPPRAGWSAWVADSEKTMRFDGTAWQVEVPDLQDLDLVGVNATADATNRLTVASAATLLTHSGAGHQLKVNKAGTSDTASLLFQSGWSGLAEMGIIGSDDFAIKVSDDGSSFQTALTADATTGEVNFPNGATGLATTDMGAGPLTTRSYAISRGNDLVANGTGSLGTGYNYPAAFVRDPVITPDLTAAFAYNGYTTGRHDMTEVIPVDPNACYQLSCLIRQEGLPGDFSGYTHEDRHAHSFGAICIDADGLEISPLHHARYKSGGTDSLTTLAAPLTPGDTEVHLTDASGWNDSDTEGDNLGLIIFAYRDSYGRSYDRYSRISGSAMFLPAGVNKTTHVITLDAPFPSAMGNPDDGSGTWPVGTPIANTSTGNAFKAVMDAQVLDAADTWYRAKGFLGGIDRSGGDEATNFAPGTVGIRLGWIPNQSLVSAGAGGFPDTGSGHQVWVAGASLQRSAFSLIDRITTGSATGACALLVPEPSDAFGNIQLVTAATSLTALV